MLDLQDRKILNLLQEDGRHSYSHIGKEIGLSITAVKDRIDKLTVAGVLKNFSVVVDEKKVGYSILAFVFIGIEALEDCNQFEMQMREIEEVQECHHVTGAFNYLIKVLSPDMESLEKLLANRIKSSVRISRTETTIVFSSAKNTAFVNALAGDRDE